MGKNQPRERPRFRNSGGERVSLCGMRDRRSVASNPLQGEDAAPRNPGGTPAFCRRRGRGPDHVGPASGHGWAAAGRGLLWQVCGCVCGAGPQPRGDVRRTLMSQPHGMCRRAGAGLGERPPPCCQPRRRARGPPARRWQVACAGLMAWKSWAAAGMLIKDIWHFPRGARPRLVSSRRQTDGEVPGTLAPR